MLLLGSVVFFACDSHKKQVMEELKSALECYGNNRQVEVYHEQDLLVVKLLPKQGEPPEPEGIVRLTVGFVDLMASKINQRGIPKEYKSQMVDQLQVLQKVRSAGFERLALELPSDQGYIRSECPINVTQLVSSIEKAAHTPSIAVK